MTTFDKREDAFEKQFAHDEELKFKATARCNKLLGLWAAEKLGLSGAEADSYALAAVMAAIEGNAKHEYRRKNPQGFRCQGCRAVRSSDRPHDGRADGEGGRRHQGRPLTKPATAITP